MKSGIRIALVIVALLVVIVGGSLIGGYNALVDRDIAVDEAFTSIDGRLQQRYDTIGQMIGAIEGLQEQQAAIYQMITDARTQYLNARQSGDVEALVEADAAQAEAMMQLLAIVETNPEGLNVGALYYTLMDTIASLENQLFVARRDYNEAVADYNASTRRFPSVLYAQMFGFERERPYWRLSDGAGEVPVIDIGS
jgi:LemA protein